MNFELDTGRPLPISVSWNLAGTRAIMFHLAVHVPTWRGGATHSRPLHLNWWWWEGSKGQFNWIRRSTERCPTPCSCALRLAARRPSFWRGSGLGNNVGTAAYWGLGRVLAM